MLLKVIGPRPRCKVIGSIDLMQNSLEKKNETCWLQLCVHSWTQWFILCLFHRTDSLFIPNLCHSTSKNRPTSLVWSGVSGHLPVAWVFFFFFFEALWHSLTSRMRSWSVWCNRQRQECWSTAYTELQHMSSLTDAWSALSAVALWQYLHPLFIIPNKNWIICGYLCNSFRLLYDLTLIALGEVCIRFLC